MNRNSQLMIEILWFHQPVRPKCQTNRGKKMAEYFIFLFFSFIWICILCLWHDYFHHEDTTYMCILFSVSLLPLYPTQAGGEFGSVCSMVCDALTTLSVTRTVFRTRAINIIMWTGHGEQNQLEFIIVATN